MLLRRGSLTTTYIRTAKCDALNGNDREQLISFAECMGGYVEIKNSERGVQICFTHRIIPVDARDGHG
jgi:hypothetical protein